MRALRTLYKKLTPTRALVMCSGKFEKLFFEEVYRVTYLIGLSTIEDSLSYLVYGSLVKLMLVLLMCGELSYCFMHNITVAEKVGNINVIILQLITLYRYKNMFDNKTAYKQLVASMESPHFDTTTVKRRMLVDFWAKKNKQYLKLLIGLGNCTLLAWYIYPLIDDIEYNLIIGIYFPYAYTTPDRYPFVYTSLVIAFEYIAHFVMIVDVTMQAHMIHLLCQLTVLGDCFENLLEDCREGFEDIHPNDLIYNNEFADKYSKRMGNLVEQHRLILCHIMNLRNSLSRPMFCQFMASGTLICFVGFETILTLTVNAAKTVNNLFFLGFNIFELFIICLWCDEIRVQSQNIGEAIYCCGWESGMSLLPGIKQTVKLVITRANKPLAFTAGGLSTTDRSICYLVYRYLVRLLIVMFMVGEVWFLSSEAHGLQLDDIAACINVIGIQIITFYKAKNMMDHRDIYRRIASSMESPYFDTTTDKRKRLVRYWADEHEKYLKLMLGLGNCTLAAWHIYPLVDELDYNLMVSIRLPFSYNSPHRYPFAYLIVGTAFMYISHFIMVTDMIMQAHLVPLVCQLTVLADGFVNIIEDCRFAITDCKTESIVNKDFITNYQKRLGILIEQHKLILSYTMDLRAILSGPLLGQMGASGILICFVGYQATTSVVGNIAKCFMSLFYLSYHMLSLYVICRWCEEITIQGQNIGEAAYRSGWEAGLSTLPGVRATITMVIIRANKPLVFTAGGMYSLSLKAYTSLVKTSYSALTVLLRFRHD